MITNRKEQKKNLGRLNNQTHHKLKFKLQALEQPSPQSTSAFQWSVHACMVQLALVRKA